jgi:hypothetical protein
LVYDKNKYWLLAVHSLCTRKTTEKKGMGERMRVDSDKDGGRKWAVIRYI